MYLPSGRSLEWTYNFGGRGSKVSGKLNNLETAYAQNTTYNASGMPVWSRLGEGLNVTNGYNARLQFSTKTAQKDVSGQPLSTVLALQQLCSQ